MPEETTAGQPTSYAEFTALMDKPSEAAPVQETERAAETDGTVTDPEGSSAAASTENPEGAEETDEETEASLSQVQDPSVSKRIKKLLADRRKERTENQKLLRQIADLTTPKEKPQETTTPAPSAAKDWYADDDPKNPKPKQENFKTWEEFSDAAADWRAERTLQKREFERNQQQVQQEFTTARQQLDAEHAARLEKSPVKDKVMELVGPGKAKEKVFFPDPVADFIKSSEHGPEVFLKLLEDDAAYKAVVAIRHPQLQWRALQKIEATFSKPVAPEKKVTSAPKPPTVLGGRSTPAGAAKPEEAGSYNEFNRLMDRKAG
jgi:hypothetical protein